MCAHAYKAVTPVHAIKVAYTEIELYTASTSCAPHIGGFLRYAAAGCGHRTVE